MKASLRCKGCSHAWTVHAEPRALVDLMCPSCQSTASAPAAEDFASALEDALVQLFALSQTHSIQVQLSSEAIPASFVPQADDAGEL